MLTVPLQPTPNQAVSVPLANQNTTVRVYQKSTALFMDVLVDGAPIISGVICQNRNRIVRDVYLGFIGDFAFVDLQGSEDPVYTGLGSRFQLRYLELADLAGLS